MFINCCRLSCQNARPQIGSDPWQMSFNLLAKHESKWELTHDAHTKARTATRHGREYGGVALFLDSLTTPEQISFFPIIHNIVFDCIDFDSGFYLKNVRTASADAIYLYQNCSILYIKAFELDSTIALVGWLVGWFDQSK